MLFLRWFATQWTLVSLSFSSRGTSPAESSLVLLLQQNFFQRSCVSGIDAVALIIVEYGFFVVLIDSWAVVRFNNRKKIIYVSHFMFCI